MAKKRNPSFEILRILAMFLIVVWHFLIHGIGLKPVGTTDSAISLFNCCSIEFIGCLAKVSTNCYILISGYFMITTSFKWRKITKVWIPIFFYSVLISTILLLIGNKHIHGWNSLWESALPIYFDRYWFATRYIALVALAPFFAFIAKNITKKEYLMMLAVLLIINLDFLLGQHFSANNSLLWFIFVFFMGGYIRLHSNFNGRNHYGKLYFAAAGTIAAITLIANFCHYDLFNSPIILHYHNNNGVAFISALFLFLWAAKLKVKDTKFTDFLMKVAPLTYGVYLIHDNIYIRTNLWKDLLSPKSHIGDWTFTPYLIAVAVSIFVACLAIDWLRDRLFKVLKINERIDAISDRMHKINISKFKRHDN